MRIVGGSARGRRLRVPPAGTRPTSQRAREALFNRVATLLDLDGISVLDLYAGSGALGLEAVSRGASRACFVESDRRAVDVLRANVSAITAGVDHPVHATVERTPVEAFVAGPVPAAFDLIVADPPYDLAGPAVAEVLDRLAGSAWCVPGGVIVVERAARAAALQWPEPVEALAAKRYGDGVLWYGRLR